MTAWRSRSDAGVDPGEAAAPWSREAFEAKLRELGRYYHTRHPYQQMMARGELDRAQIQGWVINRFYYQVSIPQKDAAILANCPDREVRRAWIQRIMDHDGYGDDSGGIEAWLQLGTAVGVSREYMLSFEGVLPGVRFAVDAYVEFARSRPWQEAVCASLTELFAPEAHRSRLATWPEHYPWVEAEGLAYFRNRLTQAQRDVEYALAVTLDAFRSAKQQRCAVDVLGFKLDVLWTMLDVMYMAYVVGMPPYQAIAEEP